MSQSDQEHIQPPGTEAEMTPQADHGETSYKGCDKLAGCVAVITGGDSGIGRAVAIAYAREGADILISYLNEQEDEDARETARHVEAAGRRCVLVPGDIAEPTHCRAIVDRAVRQFGRIDILVNNAAFQRTYESLEDIPDEEWDYTSAPTSQPCCTWPRLPFLTWGLGRPSSTRRRSNRTSPTPCSWPTLRQRAQFRILRRASPKCWGARASG